VTDSDARARAHAQLDDFYATLTPRDQAALRVVLRRARAAGEELTPAEAEEVDRLRAEPDPPAGDLAGITMIMKATRLCNLRCTYCHSWRAGPNQRMCFSVLARATRDVLRDPAVGHVAFVWHGGEPTLLPSEFFRKALWLQGQFRRPGQVIQNHMQTNGTLLTEEWTTFLRDHGIGVGVSLDGPPEIHDSRRVDVAGRPTSQRVRAGLEQLARAGISRVATLMVVDDAVCDAGAERVLEYLLDIGVSRVALLNVLPENTAAGTVAGAFLPFGRYVEFLRDLYRAWWPEHRDQLDIRELSALAGQVQGGPSGICLFAGDCFGAYLTVEPDGVVSACDKYIEDADYRFGNVLESGLTGARASRRLAAVRAEARAQVEHTRGCRWFSVCHGGCPHDVYTSQRRLGRGDMSCCGLAPLLDDMATTLVTTPE
jgi:uncharacterized protein